jgi:hypothetical protein
LPQAASQPQPPPNIVNNSKALAEEAIHSIPTDNTAAKMLFIGGLLEIPEHEGRRKRKQRVAGTAGPAMLSAMAVGRNRDAQATAQHVQVLSLAVAIVGWFLRP